MELERLGGSLTSQCLRPTYMWLREHFLARVGTRNPARHAQQSATGWSGDSVTNSVTGRGQGGQGQGAEIAALGAGLMADAPGEGQVQGLWEEGRTFAPEAAQGTRDFSLDSRAKETSKIKTTAGLFAIRGVLQRLPLARRREGQGQRKGKVRGLHVPLSHCPGNREPLIQSRRSSHFTN